MINFNYQLMQLWVGFSLLMIAYAIGTIQLEVKNADLTVECYKADMMDVYVKE